MSAGTITALVIAITGLVTAVGTLLSQISHLNWHKAAQQQPTYTPPAPPVTPPHP